MVFFSLISSTFAASFCGAGGPWIHEGHGPVSDPRRSITTPDFAQRRKLADAQAYHQGKPRPQAFKFSLPGERQKMAPRFFIYCLINKYCS